MAEKILAAVAVWSCGIQAPQRINQIKAFTYLLKYFIIYQTDWHKPLYRCSWFPDDVS